MKVQKDKVKHFTISFLLVIVYTLTLYKLPLEIKYTSELFIGSLGSFSTGLTWEVIRAEKHGFDIYDIVANIAGIILAVILLTIFPLF